MVDSERTTTHDEQRRDYVVIGLGDKLGLVCVLHWFWGIAATIGRGAETEMRGQVEVKEWQPLDKKEGRLPYFVYQVCIKFESHIPVILLSIFVVLVFELFGWGVCWDFFYLYKFWSGFPTSIDTTSWLVLWFHIFPNVNEGCLETGTHFLVKEW